MPARRRSRWSSSSCRSRCCCWSISSRPGWAAAPRRCSAMAAAPSLLMTKKTAAPGARSRHLQEPRAVQWLLVGAAMTYLALFLFLPLLVVFASAFEKGLAVYLAAVTEPVAVSAIRLTLLTAAIVVPINLLFGLAAAWAIAKFQFPGRGLLMTLIDVPFSVSPVISGMVFVLLFGAQGFAGPLLFDDHIKI